MALPKAIACFLNHVSIMTGITGEEYPLFHGWHYQGVSSINFLKEIGHRGEEALTSFVSFRNIPL
jgi:hypothetical protein